MMDSLTKIALMGTAQATAGLVNETLFTENQTGDNAELHAVLPPGEHSAENALLLKSGVAAVYRLAGQKPVSVEAIEAAPEETRSIVPVGVARILERLWESPLDVLLPEVLQVIAEKDLLLPAEILPRALTVTGPELQRLVRAVAGQRGVWLSQWNADWSWMQQREAENVAQLVDPEQLKQNFEHAGQPERIELLAQLRRHHPEQARDLLSEIFPQERADVRVLLLEQLAVNLSEDDEPFLESCLDGRSTQVRAAAAPLLARIPNSRYAARMLARAEGMLSLTSEGLLRKRPKLSCTPPQELDKADERDGLPSKLLVGKIGKRAYWAQVILSQVPPTHWTNHFELGPQELIEAARKDDFADDILSGWGQATVLHAANNTANNSNKDSATHAWIVPLFEAFRHSQHERHQGLIPELIALVPQESAETLVQGWLCDPSTNVGQNMVAEILQRLPRPWSESFTRAYLTQLEVAFKGTTSLYAWAPTLEIAVLAVHPATLPLVSAAWEKSDVHKAESGYHATRRSLENHTEISLTRHAFYTAIQSIEPAVSSR